MIVLDTHALVWWLADPARLSTRARRTIAKADDARELAASAVSILEISTAVRRGRLVFTVALAQWLNDLQTLVRVEPVTADIAAAAGGYAEVDLPGDPADRLIVATTAALGARLVSADRHLQRQKIVGVVW